jgi:hypothetical protein
MTAMSTGCFLLATVYFLLATVYCLLAPLYFQLRIDKTRAGCDDLRIRSFQLPGPLEIALCTNDACRWRWSRGTPS